MGFVDGKLRVLRVAPVVDDQDVSRVPVEAAGGHRARRRIAGGRPVVQVRRAGLPVQGAGGSVQFSTTTSGMPSKSFSLFVTRATPSEIAWAAICRS